MSGIEESIFYHFSFFKERYEAEAEKKPIYKTLYYLNESGSMWNIWVFISNCIKVLASRRNNPVAVSIFHI